MQSFEIGEVAILVFPGNKFHGTEVKVLSELKPVGTSFSLRTGESGKLMVPMYEIEYCDGDTGGSPPSFLKKKPSDAKEWFEQKIKLEPVTI